MDIKHVCQSCGELLAVHFHRSYQEIKDCLTGMKPVCANCDCWPGCPLPSEGTRGQDYPALSNQSGVNNG
jgi:hypothetical protein